MFDDFEKFGKVPDAYEQPERQGYKPQVHAQSRQLVSHLLSCCAVADCTSPHVWQ